MGSRGSPPRSLSLRLKVNQVLSVKFIKVVILSPYPIEDVNHLANSLSYDFFLVQSFLIITPSNGFHGDTEKSHTKTLDTCREYLS